MGERGRQRKEEGRRKGKGQEYSLRDRGAEGQKAEEGTHGTEDR